MPSTVFVINKKTGKIGKFPKHLLEGEENLELYVPEVVEEVKEEVSLEETDNKPLSYKEMKELAAELGLEIKGNIKKKELKELLEL